MRLVLNATNRCNLNCKTCLRSSHTPEDIDINIIKSVISKLKKDQVSDISITGGEPILHPNFKEIVEEIVTNGFWDSNYTKRSDMLAIVLSRYNLQLNQSV